MIIVSACLAGIKCRWNGSSSKNEEIVELVKKGQAIPVCPEQLGGLETPRKVAEILDNKVITKDGYDVTDSFVRGAFETLNICKMYNCDKAILKSKSPSCGCGSVYNGKFNGTLISGNGITSNLLKNNGIEVISDKDFI